MAVSFVGSLQSGVNNGGSPSVSCTTALNTTGGGSGGTMLAGDLMIAVSGGFNRAAGNHLVSGGAAWTEVVNITGAGSNRFRVAHRFVQATDVDASPTTVTAAGTANNADGDALLLLVFRGVNSAVPLDGVTVTTAQNAASTNPDPPSITPTSNDDCVVIGYGSSLIDASPGTVTNYSLSQTTSGNDTNDIQIGAGYRVLSGGAGTPENPAAWSSYSSSAWYTFSLVLKPPVVLSAESGGFTFTGTAASLERGYEIPAEAGEFVFTGTAASLVHGHPIVAGSGEFVFTGTPATLLLGYEIAAESGEFVWSGTDASLELGYELAADSGTFVFTGSDVTLTVSAGGGDPILVADGGAFLFTGSDVSLERGYEIAADGGAFLFTGTAVTLLATHKLVADSAAFVWTGSDVALERGYEIVVESGTFTFNGTEVSLLLGREIAAESGAFIFTGSAATLTYSGSVAGPPELHSIPFIGTTGAMLSR